MGGDVVRPEFLGQMVRNSLRESPCIYEHQRGAMLLDQFHEAVVYLVPHFVGRDGAKLAGGNFDREIELPFVADVNDYGVWTLIACEEMGNLFNRLLCRGEANAHRRTMRQGFQP